MKRNLLAALDGLANLNNVKTRGERLLELLGLGLVINREGVEESRASDFELGHLLAVSTGGALDARSSGVLSTSDLEELLNVGDLLRLWMIKKGAEGKGQITLVARTCQGGSRWPRRDRHGKQRAFLMGRFLPDYPRQDEGGAGPTNAERA